MDRYLVLENGMVFRGKGFGADKEVTAEIVFTTAMTGYIETLTDPSYTGQAVVQTFPLIGNYGIIPEDAESRFVSPSAYIVRNYCEEPSNFRAEETLDNYLKAHGIPGLYDIDTRRLTRVLRENGTMNGRITGDPDEVNQEALKQYRAENPVSRVTVSEMEIRKAENEKYRVALLDFGKKENICRSLLKRGCTVYVLPAETDASEILSLHPDGLFLSNGPGDPEENKAAIEALKELLPHQIPTMGICLGHQLLALAHGFATEKLKYGHRGANQPVRCSKNGRSYISSQSHGYAVVTESIGPQVAEPLFTNVNDNTNEGLLYHNLPAFSVQFHPEACGGPRDTDFLFDDFISLIDRRTFLCH